jgi:uncharacterized RDD family membrane protein YckC
MADESNPFAAWYGGEAGGGPIPAVTRPSYALAGWWSRAGALVLDSIVMLVPFGILIVVFHQIHTTQYLTVYGTVATTTTTASGTWLDGAIVLLYPIVLLTRAGFHNGQTLGTQASRIRVVRNDGKPVDLVTVLIREGVGKAIIPAILFESSAGLRPLAALAGIYILLDYLWPLWERENRALHDLLASTHVIRLDEGQAPRFSPGQG